MCLIPVFGEIGQRYCFRSAEFRILVASDARSRFKHRLIYPNHEIVDCEASEGLILNFVCDYFFINRVCVFFFKEFMVDFLKREMI